MSRAKSTSASNTSTNTGALPHGALAAFLRSLAARAEADPAFAAQIDLALRESGLLDRPLAASRAAPTSPAALPSRKRSGSHPRATARDAWQQFEGLDLPDPFALLRDRGEAGLRASLDALDLPALRALVRLHRLDPARISARWTVRDRVVSLIVAQVRARADLGKAFSHV